MNYDEIPLIAVSGQSTNTDFLVTKSDTEIRSVTKKSLIPNQIKDLPINLIITNKKEVKDFLLLKGGYLPFSYQNNNYTCSKFEITSLGRGHYRFNATFKTFY